MKRYLADEQLWALSYLRSVEAEQTFILMNPKYITNFLEYIFVWGYFSWLVLCISLVCLYKHRHRRCWIFLWCLFYPPQASCLHQRTPPQLKRELNYVHGREKSSTGIHLQNCCSIVEVIPSLLTHLIVSQQTFWLSYQNLAQFQDQYSSIIYLFTLSLPAFICIWNRDSSEVDGILIPLI